MKKLLTALAILMVILIAGCKNDDFVEVDGVCPVVSSTSPIDGATNVVLDKIITATFNVSMNPLTFSQATFSVQSPTKSSYADISGTVSYDEATKTVSFTPSSLLIDNTTYTCRITEAVKDLRGSALQTDYVWNFSTGLLLSPTVISTSPVNNEIGVAFDKTITATFSTPMNSATITETTFTLFKGVTQIAGEVTYSGSIASFNPDNLLLADSVYTATLTTGVENEAGTALESNYVWTFTAASILAPTIILTDPQHNDINVAINKTITVKFSEPMNSSTIDGTSFTLFEGLNPVAGSILYADSVASFNPNVDLLPGSTYTVTIGTGVESVAGIALENDSVWQFTVATVPAPTIILTDPQHNDINVAINKTITVKFSEPMNSSTIDGTSFTLFEGLNPVTGSILYADSVASFNPDVDLLPGTIYTVTVSTGVENIAGIALENDSVWEFTTIVALPPTVSSTDPADLEANVVLDKIISATFSEAMNDLTITDLTFIVETSGGIPVTGIVDLDVTGLNATFTPDVNLLSDSTYIATITTGAENVAGTPMASDYVWEFYTGPHLGPLAPPLGSVKLLGAAGGTAGLTNQGLLTTINNGGISTTAASTLITGFRDGITLDPYTVTPLNEGIVYGGIFTAPPAPGTATSEAIAQQAAIDADIAYNAISPASMPGGIDLGNGELGARTLAPGIYQSAPGSYDITLGDLTLDGQGDANAVWVFQMASTLTVGIAGPTGARSVVLINGAQAKNVYWYVGSHATINGAGGGIMVGTIIANSGVEFSTPGNVVLTVLEGRAISLIASVTMVNTTINVPLP